MKKLLLLVLVLSVALSAYSQFNTASVNSDIGTEEYGINNNNNYGSGTPQWYMTWNDTYLYLSIQDANETEPGIAYFDIDPIIPVNGGNNTNGTNVGIAYNGLSAPNLPFRANTAIYFKNDYRELRRWNGSAWLTISSGNGGLGGATDDYGNGDYSSNNRNGSSGSDDDRELRISWCRLTGGASNCRPASFNWVGYIAFTNGIYGQIPIENPSGNLGAGGVNNMARYLTVSSTTDGSSTNPMSRNSFTQTIGASDNNFSAIAVWDFTMNSPSQTITRTGGNWIIANNLVIGAGTVSFGNIGTGNGCIVSGNLTTLSGGTLSLSTAVGGDITVQGNIVDEGTFNANNRAIFFTGSNVQTIQGTGVFDIPYVRINKAGGRVVLGTDLVCAGPNGGNAMEIQGTTSILDLNGKTLTIGQNGTASTFNNGIGTSGFLRGSSASNINILGTGALGTLNFDQSTDGSTDTSLNASNSLQNFTLNRTSSGTATLGNKLIVLNTYNPTAGTLTSGGNLVFRSTFANTARITPGTSGYITGNVTVERFITSNTNRAYRLLGPSINTTGGSKPFIRDNWQEGANNTDLVTNNNLVPGYGTHITGSTTGANGFDATQTGGAGLFTYSYGSPDTYVPIPNTSGTELDAKTGYLLFIRGNRTLSNIQAAATSNNTTLRTTGTLLTGDVTYPLQGITKFTLVTNPYAAPINWSTIFSDLSNTALENFYTYLDPNIGGRGGYVTVTNAGVRTPSTGTDASLDIQTGQAFFVKSASSGTPALTIKEVHKSADNNNNVFRMGSQEQLSIGLYFNLPNGGGRRIADGVNVLFNNDYASGFDGNDAEEIANFDENLAISRGGKMLSIEGRPLIDETDTIFLTQARLKVQDYEFEFNPASFNAPGLVAYLQDKFLDTETAISLAEQTIVPFTVSSNAASSASDRFRVVFRNNTVLPINFSQVKAFEKGTQVQVEWNMGTEQNVAQYEIEKSTDGRTFTKGGVQVARTISSTDNYQWLDLQPINGNNYYRIRAIERGGQFKYSQVVNVRLGKGNSTISIYPNPVVSNVISLQFSNMEKGKYQLTLTNKAGQQVYRTMIVHSGGSATQSVSITGKLAAGSYQMQVKGNDRTINQQLIKN